MSRQSRPVAIDRLSLHSLHLTFVGGTAEDVNLGVGTGFIVEVSGRRLLLTARHCFTGRNHDTNEPLDKRTAALPSKVVVRHHMSIPGLIGYNSEVRLLDDDGSARWFEHPEFGCLLDIAAVELPRLENEATRPVVLQDLVLTFRNAVTPPRLDARLMLLPADPVSVLGYPVGLFTNATLPVWVTGSVASEPGFSHGLGGTILIDSRTREGMSGAPVFAKRLGEVMLDNGEHISFEGYADCFVGLYVGRIQKDADIGLVYRSPALLELANRGRPGHSCLTHRGASCRALGGGFCTPLTVGV
jgi:hypothetical protein